MDFLAEICRTATIRRIDHLVVLSPLHRPVRQVLGRDKESDPLDWVMSEPNGKLILDFSSAVTNTEVESRGI
jgi:hypothetical protein